MRYIYGVFFSAVVNDSSGRRDFWRLTTSKRSACACAKRNNGVVVRHTYHPGDVWDAPTFRATGLWIANFRDNFYQQGTADAGPFYRREESDHGHGRVRQSADQ